MADEKTTASRDRDIIMRAGEARPPSTSTVPQASVPQAYAPPRMRSAAYAQAQAEWDAIENELAYTKDQAESLRAQVKVGEETIKALRLEREELRAHNERLLRENTTIGSSVARAVDVLIGLKQEIERIKNGHGEALSASVEAEAKLAIERAMHEEGPR